MKLILIRHAESLANVKGITQGQKINEPLSDLGKLQAQKLAKYLKDETVEAIFSSDLKRAISTAEEISNALKKKIIIDKRLREKDHDNEQNEEFITRCKAFLEDVKKYSGTVIAVAHGGSIRTILAISTGDRKKGAELFNSVEQHNTGISELIYLDGKWTRATINKTEHLLS